MKISYPFLLLATLIFSSVSFASEEHCSSPEGALQYHSFSYSGGAAPPPGMLMHKETWILSGKIIYQTSVHTPCQPSPAGTCTQPKDDVVDPNLVIEFLPKTAVTLYESDPRQYFDYHRTYAVKAQIYKKSGEKLFNDFLLCKLHRLMLP